MSKNIFKCPSYITPMVKDDVFKVFICFTDSLQPEDIQFTQNNKLSYLRSWTNICHIVAFYYFDYQNSYKLI